MTYAESRERLPFDWHEFLTHKKLTEADAEAAHLLALSWVTCACGNQCSALPRCISGIPRDLILARLGRHFAKSVDHIRSAVSCGGPWHHAQQKALATLQEIEARSAVLLRQPAAP